MVTPLRSSPVLIMSGGLRCVGSQARSRRAHLVGWEPDCSPCPVRGRVAYRWAFTAAGFLARRVACRADGSLGEPNSAYRRAGRPETADSDAISAAVNAERSRNARCPRFGTLSEKSRARLVRLAWLRDGLVV